MVTTNRARERAKNLKIRNEIMASRREKTLWKWFSLYIRLRDSIDNGFARCITCGKPHYYREMDAGHYIPQKNNYGTLYNEKNVHAQCKNCNQYGHGEVEKYHDAIVEKYGAYEVEELHKLAKQPSNRMLLAEVEAKSAYYRQKAKDEAYLQGVEL